MRTEAPTKASTDAVAATADVAWAAPRSMDMAPADAVSFPAEAPAWDLGRRARHVPGARLHELGTMSPWRAQTAVHLASDLGGVNGANGANAACGASGANDSSPPNDPHIPQDRQPHKVPPASAQPISTAEVAALEAPAPAWPEVLSAAHIALLDQFDAQLHAIEAELAAQVQRVALELARQVVGSELQWRPQAVASVAQEAVATLVSAARRLRLHCHPQDLPLIEAHAGEALRLRQVQCVADAGIARGGVRVHSDAGSVDATVPARWLRCSAALTPPDAAALQAVCTSLG